MTKTIKLTVLTVAAALMGAQVWAADSLESASAGAAAPFAETLGQGQAAQNQPTVYARASQAAGLARYSYALQGPSRPYGLTDVGLSRQSFGLPPSPEVSAKKGVSGGTIARAIGAMATFVASTAIAAAAFAPMGMGALGALLGASIGAGCAMGVGFGAH